MSHDDENSNDEKADLERMREILIDLHRSQTKEKELRLESEALLAGLQTLISTDSIDEVFPRLLETMRPLLGFEQAFILMHDDLNAPFIAAYSTDPVFLNSRWEIGKSFTRVLNGSPLLSVDVWEMDEWEKQPDFLKKIVTSGIHIPLKGHKRDAIWICVHSQRAFFNRRHQQLATRLIPLASQALINIEKSEELKNALVQLKEMQMSLIQASRMAGMSEVATGILHNVGNVLNSVNLSSDLILGKVTSMKIDSLEKLSQLLNEHADDLGAFLKADTASNVLAYLSNVTNIFKSDKEVVVSEVKILKDKIEHIKDIVRSQQKYGQVTTLLEDVHLISLVQEALRLCESAMQISGIEIVKNVPEYIVFKTDRHKVLQILVNLIQNAGQAIQNCPRKTIHIEASIEEKSKVLIKVKDTGSGISKENLTKVFTYGFTTKTDGHGMGLHVSALYAQEFGGQLTASSEGEGQGATFTLVLPYQ